MFLINIALVWTGKLLLVGPQNAYSPLWGHLVPTMLAKPGLHTHTHSWNAVLLKETIPTDWHYLRCTLFLCILINFGKLSFSLLNNFERMNMHSDHSSLCSKARNCRSLNGFQTGLLWWKSFRTLPPSLRPRGIGFALCKKKVVSLSWYAFPFIWIILIGLWIYVHQCWGTTN